MNKLKGIILGTLLGASALFAQNKTSLTGTYNATDNSTQIRTENSWNKEGFSSYGFLDLYGDKNLDFETFYSEINARKDLGNGFGAGLEANIGTDYEDKVRPHVSLSVNLGPVFVDLKYSPVSTSGEDHQAGIFAATDIAGFGLSGWADFDYANSKITPSGEVQLEKKIGETDVSLVGRVEKFPWQKTANFSVCGKYEF